MPRKKKSNLERKPSLVFTESPVNIQKNVLTPVLCARHPPTASSIPIENLNLSWVSPQFRHITLSGGRRRLRTTRQRRHSVASHRHLINSDILNKENAPLSNHKTKLKKFNSLKFVGERTCASIVEDVEITVDTDTGTDEDNHVENRITAVMSPCRVRRHSVCGTGNNRQVRTRTDHIQELSLEENSTTSDDNDLNSIHPFKLKAPVKRLFASQLEKNPGNSDDTNYKLTSNNNMLHDLPAHIQSQTVSESESESPSVLRRSARIQQFRRLLNITDSPNRSVCSNVHSKMLAPDTPEQEYGWSLRKRQLIKYVQKTS